MARFDDPELLRDRLFPFALAPREPYFSIDDAVPQTSNYLSLYIDQNNIAQVGAKLNLHRTLDPLDSDVEAKYSTGNKFIAGLRREIGVPNGGIIAFPTYNPRQAASQAWLGIGLDYEGSLSYPDDVPPGYVPCCGQLLRYPDGSVWQVPLLSKPDLTQGNNIADPGMVFLQKVPEGWDVEQDPLLKRSDRSLRSLAGVAGGF